MGEHDMNRLILFIFFIFTSILNIISFAYCQSIDTHSVIITYDDERYISDPKFTPNDDGLLYIHGNGSGADEIIQYNLTSGLKKNIYTSDEHINIVDFLLFSNNDLLLIKHDTQSDEYSLVRKSFLLSQETVLIKDNGKEIWHMELIKNETCLFLRYHELHQEKGWIGFFTLDSRILKPFMEILKYEYVDINNDGDTLFLTNLSHSIGIEESYDLWSIDIEKNISTMLTGRKSHYEHFEEFSEYHPMGTPNEKIIFWATHHDWFDPLWPNYWTEDGLYAISVDGSHPEFLLPLNEEPLWISMSKDCKWLSIGNQEKIYLYENALPDVKPINADIPEFFESNNLSLSIPINITNTGSTYFSSSSARLIINGEIVQELPVPELESNVTELMTFNTYLSPGFYNITISIDPDNQVIESDETNNIWTTQIEVIPKPPGTAEVTALNTLLPIILIFVSLIVYGVVITRKLMGERDRPGKRRK